MSLGLVESAGKSSIEDIRSGLRQPRTLYTYTINKRFKRTRHIDRNVLFVDSYCIEETGVIDKDFCKTDNIP